MILVIPFIYKHLHVKRPSFLYDKHTHVLKITTTSGNFKSLKLSLYEAFAESLVTLPDLFDRDTYPLGLEVFNRPNVIGVLSCDLLRSPNICSYLTCR